MKKYLLFMTVIITFFVVGLDTLYAGETMPLTDINKTTGKEDVFRVDGTNKYFPNMTLDEIKKWYTEEVTKFIATGKDVNNYTLDEFQEGIKIYSDFLSRGINLEIFNMKEVERYNKEETKDFYEVQVKIRSFIKEYFETEGLVFNWSDWNVETTETITTITPTTERETTTVQKTADEPETTVIQEETTVQEQETVTTVENERTSSFNVIPIVVVGTLLAMAAGICLVIHKMKKDD